MKRVIPVELRSPLWERQTGESDRAFKAFCFYRDMPTKDRSLRKGLDAYTGRPGSHKTILYQWSLWSVQWRWVQRIQAWEDEQDRVARLARLDAIKKMQERHVRQAMLLQQKAITRLQDLDVSELDPLTLLRYITEATRLERLSMGQPDTIADIKLDWREEVKRIGLDPTSVYNIVVNALVQSDPAQIHPSSLANIVNGTLTDPDIPAPSSVPAPALSAPDSNPDDAHLDDSSPP